MLPDAGAARRCCEAAAALAAAAVREEGGEEEALAALARAHCSEAEVAAALAALLARLAPAWRAEAAGRQTGLPRLRSLEWRVDVKTASSHAGGMGVPGVIVQMNIDGGPEEVVAFEMDKETLSALLSGLGKIRNQLAGLN